MADIPQPYNNAGLIMQAFSNLGGLGTAMEQERQLNEPLHPALQKYIDRMLRGENPQQLGLEAQKDPAIQAMLATLNSGPTPRPAPQTSVADGGYAPGGRYPTVQAPGGMSPAGGPSGPMGAFGGGGGGGAWNTSRPLLSGAPASPQGLTKQTPGLGGAPYSLMDANGNEQARSLVGPQPAAQPPPRDPGLQPGEESFRVVPVSIGDMPGQAKYGPEAGLGAAPPAQQPPQQAPAAAPPPAAVPPPEAQTAPQQRMGQPTPASVGVTSQTGARQYTRRDLRDMGPIMPALVAGASRENVANIRAQSSMEVARLQQSVRAGLGVLRERGLDVSRYETVMLGAEKLDTTMQIAVMQEIGRRMNAEMENETRRQGIAQRGTKQDWERLRLINGRIKNLETERGAVAGSALRGPGGKISQDALAQLQRIDAEIDTLKQHEADLSKLFAPTYAAPAPGTPGTPGTSGVLGFGATPGTPPQPAQTPGGKAYDSISFDQAAGTITYLMGGQPVETQSTRNPKSQLP